MEQKHNTLSNESELRDILDKFYKESKEAIENEQKPIFKDLLEIINSEVVILTAIHNLKSNKGSMTAGIDNENIREDFLQKDYPSVIKRVKESLDFYKPVPVRRVFIPKPGKTEKRPLGIPAMIDRIVQECVRIVIEPILEAQFFEHSYGFRPYRDADMAMSRIAQISIQTKHHWVVEGDIKGFFDNVNHSILIKRLYGIGIRDRRVLMIIKSMLKAGIMNEVKYSELGTPQGGILSPLLANTYLDAMDKWITREWEKKKMNPEISKDKRKSRALERYSKQKSCYLVRYADDWVLFCKSREDALKYKNRITKYLKGTLKLSLSEDKTFITNIRKKAIKFLGFEFKVKKDNKKREGWKAKRYSWMPNSRPDRDRLKSKAKDIHWKVKNLKKVRHDNRLGLIHEINKVNATIRGVINYYQSSGNVNSNLAKYAPTIKYAAFKTVKKFGGTWGPADEMTNLPSIHSNYKSYVAYITYEGMKIGITGFDFCKFKENTIKSQNETPYSQQGRNLYRKRTGKKPLLARADELLKLHTSSLIATKRTKAKYNFEYFLNKAYVFNRDKGKCKICGEDITEDNVHFHHVNNKLPLFLINRVSNLATVHIPCHKMIHSKEDFSHVLSKNVFNKLMKYRAKLGIVD